MEQSLPPPRSYRPSARALRRGLVAVAIATALVMIAASRLDRVDVVTWAAAAFAAAAFAVAVVDAWRASHWPRAPRAPLVPAYVALRQSTALACVAYAWGAVTMLCLYLTPLTGLRWQHGWQYAAAMALLAASSLFYLRSLEPAIRSGVPTGQERQFRWAVPLALAQAAVAAIGLVALGVSGKLLSTRADWAANRVFAALAVAILAVTLCSVVVRRRLIAAARVS